MKKYMKQITTIGMLIFTANLSADSLTDKVDSYLTHFQESLPGSAVVKDRLEMDGLVLSNFTLDTGSKYTILSPEDEVIIDMDYEVIADDIDAFDWQHYVYGLDKIGPEGCLADNFGLISRSGHMQVSFKAPRKRGIYQLRVMKSSQSHFLNLSKVDWEQAKSEATIAFIVVD